MTLPNQWPYIGVSCFMRQAQVLEALRSVPQGHRRRLMVGTVASSKTLAGLPNSMPDKFPPIEDIAGIYHGIDDRRVFNLIHYATDEPDTLQEQLGRLMEFGGTYLHGLQLNIVWPDPRVLFHFPVKDDDYDRPFIVLQLSPHLMEDGSPEAIATRLGDYDGLVEAVLVDRSRGKGLGIDVEETRRIFEAIRANPKCNDIDLGLAGGLNSGNLQVVAELVRDFDANIDAENALRCGLRKALDPIFVKSYLERAFALFP